MIKKIFFLFLLLFSCGKNNIIIPNDFFNVNFEIPRGFLGISTNNTFWMTTHIDGYYENIDAFNYFYNDKNELMQFDNIDKEIFYQRIILSDDSLDQTFNFYLAINNDKCIYIIWPYTRNTNLNIKYSTLMDLKEISFNKKSINVFTNLKMKQFQYLFPNFIGKIYDGKVSKVMIDTTLKANLGFKCTNNNDYKNIYFYNRIRFINLSKELPYSNFDFIRQIPK